MNQQLAPAPQAPAKVTVQLEPMRSDDTIPNFDLPSSETDMRRVLGLGKK